MAGERDAQAITQARDAGCAAFNAGDVEKFIKVWVDDDAIFMHPNEPPMVGKAEIQKWLETLFLHYCVQQMLASEELVIAGDWAFERLSVHETFTPKTGGEAVRNEGKGIDIYRRQSDGSWKVARSISNSNLSSLALLAQSWRKL